MTKLQILIPQYNENEKIIKPLLDSIAIQQGINLKQDIEIFIGNDGSDTKLDIEFLKKYPFRIQYHFFKHEGLAATRKKLQSLASADYIMFCDADDQFISMIALQIILQQINISFDVLCCDFLEEHIQSNNTVVHILHQKDAVFVHGKVYRRQFLIDNKIQWNPTLREHQDSAFNVLAHILSKSTQYCTVPLYLWHDNPNSISRKNGKYHPINTWPAMIDSYQSLINDLKDRGLGDLASWYTQWCLYSTYYEMSHARWKENNHEQEKINTYKRIVEFYNTNELLFKKVTPEDIQKISQQTKEVAKSKGKFTDMPPFEEWLEAILKIFK